MSHPSLNEAERAQVALEDQKELLEEMSDELAKDGEISVETVVERFDEIYNKQKEIVEFLDRVAKPFRLCSAEQARAFT